MNKLKSLLAANLILLLILPVFVDAWVRTAGYQEKCQEMHMSGLFNILLTTIFTTLSDISIVMFAGMESDNSNVRQCLSNVLRFGIRSMLNNGPKSPENCHFDQDYYANFSRFTIKYLFRAFSNFFRNRKDGSREQNCPVSYALY